MHASEPNLTPREKEIVRLVVSGEKRGAIAVTLHIHLSTVDFHLVNCRRKLHVFSIVGLAVWGARANGALTGPPAKH